MDGGDHLQSKMGKDKMWPLKHNSEICFAGLKKKLFVFMSMEANSDSLPPELNNKYKYKRASCEFRVTNPYIINREDVINLPNFLVIVLELTEGGELFTNISEKRKLNEAQAKLHFLQIALAIKYLYFKQIHHLDSFPTFPTFPFLPRFPTLPFFLLFLMFLLLSIHMTILTSVPTSAHTDAHFGQLQRRIYV